MKIGGAYRPSIALKSNGRTVEIIDQRVLPWRLEIVELTSVAMAAQAIREMWVRGAPLIGATAAYGLCLALQADSSDAALERASQLLLTTRPTAANLAWGLRRIIDAVGHLSGAARVAAAYACAAELCAQDVANNRAIGVHGRSLVEGFARRGRRVNVLTHCNAGALAAVDYGTALAPIYNAHDAGIDVHVWVDETRPRNQGSALTAYELSQHGVPHTVIADSAAGRLMQQGDVDLCLVGADRVARNGDVCNKIGTYLKALAARDNGVKFYAVFPWSTFDCELECGAQVPIEQRSSAEVTSIQGRCREGRIITVDLTDSPAANPAFDITPARLVDGYVTERGVVAQWSTQTP